MMDELYDMFAWFEGPPAPVVVARAPQRSRLVRLGIAVAILLLLAAASVAGAERLDLFDGTPASPGVKTTLAQEDQGAPAALDPHIDADATVEKIDLAVPQGMVRLYVTSAARPGYTYCMGVALTWLGPGTSMGCAGSGGPPIDTAFLGLGRLGASSTIIYGHVEPADATTLALDLSDGSRQTVALTDGFFLARLGVCVNLVRETALDAAGLVVATQAVDQGPVLGIPAPKTTCG
jgi:hypothetical protein